jgi:hypothetical protein
MLEHIFVNIFPNFQLKYHVISDFSKSKWQCMQTRMEKI